jgi:hypothetical protein
MIRQFLTNAFYALVILVAVVGPPLLMSELADHSNHHSTNEKVLSSDGCPSAVSC